MSLFGSSTPHRTVAPQFTGLQIQTASSALPVPIVYGVTRVAPNIIWSGGFQTVPIVTASGGGGKGGSSSAPSTTSYDYRTAIVMGLCEGPISAISAVFRNQGSYAPASLGLSLIAGTTPQTPWSTLTASYPTKALGYPGTALAVSPSFDLGASASIGSLAFEIKGRLADTAVVNGSDADPASIISDFLTNAQYGVGFPAASISATALTGVSGDGSYQTYCRAMGLALSPCLTDQEAASSILARWLQLTNATAVWSGGLLKIVPYGDGPATGTLHDGTSVTFQPNATPIYDLNDDDFLYDDGTDPVLVTRSDPYAASNVQRLEMLNRAPTYSSGTITVTSSIYTPTPIEARDQNAIERYGLRIGATIAAHEICDTAVASTAAQLVLQRGLYVRNTYAFRLSWEYCLLEPMDLVTLTDAGLGLATTPVRITSIEEGSDGLLAVTAEEFPGTIATGGGYGVDGAAAASFDRSVAPAPVNPPVIVEPPSDLTDGIEQLWIGVSGGTSGIADPNWGGAAVYVSADNATYVQIGEIDGPARQGVLTAPLGAPPGSGGDTLSVDLTESGAVIVATGAPIEIVVDGEIMSFASATLSSSATYTLGTLQRALYGQRGGAHATGASALILDDAVFKYTLPSGAIGRTIWCKFASFNIFGTAQQDLSTCVAYPVTPVGSGSFGPVSQSIATGQSLDESLASQTITEVDDDGIASDPYTKTIDMGLASEAAASLAVQSGGTGATTVAGARANIGAAASGDNADITSLNACHKIGFATQAITIDPSTSHVGIAGYTADTNNALGVLGTACLFAASTDSMRFTFSKAAPSNDASLSFQTNFSTRALAGLLGSDDWQLKVSPDGSTYYQVVVADRTTGNASFKALLGMANYAVASLPSGFNGAVAFAMDGRKSGEVAGAGTGCMVSFSNGSWRRFSDESVVVS